MKLAIDIGGTNIRVAAISENKLLLQKKEKINKKNIKQQIIKLVKSVDKNPDTIGVAFPGIVKDGVAYEITNLPIKKLDLKSFLEKEFECNVEVAHDTNCFAIAEKEFGFAKKNNNFCTLILGTGLAAGVFCENKLLRAKDSAVGEIGRIPYKDSQLEDYCSGSFFRKKHKIKGEELELLVKKKDKKALKILNEFAVNLGVTLSILVNTYNPELIILGGGASWTFDYCKQDSLKIMKKYCKPKTLQNLTIKRSKLKEPFLLGASKL